ncbi:hypothetical protein CDV55_109156 [Aspergillus turcosus]|nr:hypothetical protein CDV55_109156 [Aspergillus turcosus]
MPGNRKTRVRWTASEKLRLLNFRDNHTHLSWEEIAKSFPGRSATALTKQYSDLKIDRDKKAAEMANNHNEETEDMASSDDGTTEEMVSSDDGTTEEMASGQNEGINTTELSKENKRLLDVEGDNETRPRKQPKSGYVAANNHDDPTYSPSEGSESEGGDINYEGDMGRSPTARQLRNTPRKQLNNIGVGSGSTLKRPSKITKLRFTSQREARDSFSTTLASPDPRTLHKEKNSTEATKTASTSSHPTLPDSPSPEKAAATNSSIISSAIASPVQRTHPSLSPAINRPFAQNPQPATNEHSPSKPEQENPQPTAKEHSPSKPEQENPEPSTNEHSPSKPEQEMAPRPASPLPGATTAPMEAGNSYGYPPMQQVGRCQ